MKYSEMPRPAFPHETGPYLVKGMTLREYFAGQALAGLLANPGGPVQARADTGWGFCNVQPDQLAHLAYELADDMIDAGQADSPRPEGPRHGG